MCRCRLASVVLGVILVQAVPLLAAPAATTALVEADVLEVYLDHQRTEAHGAASLYYGTFRLRADRFVADRSTGAVQASGDLELEQAGRCLEGETLEYNLHTEEGVLTEARVAEQGIIITGEKLIFSPTRLVAHRARFTTCDRSDPHYSLGAETISLTAEQTPSGGPPQSGRLTFDRADITYRHRRLFTVPRYSVLVGQLGERNATPLPVTGFSRDDGPYASVSYTLGEPDEPTLADFNYRYTTYRGIRGHLRVRRTVGPLELGAGYVRREDPSDRELNPDYLEAGLANVVLNRMPEYSIRLPELAVGSSLRLRGEYLRGDYSERLPGEEHDRAGARRSSIGLLLSVTPYAASHKVVLSHAIGWRSASYSPGDHLAVWLYRHRAGIDLSRQVNFSLTHVTRRGSGETPFLFDQRGPRRELLGELRWRLGSRWRFRVLDLYDLEERDARDMILELTRTAHCLDYTIGWRKSRGTISLGISLAPASSGPSEP